MNSTLLGLPREIKELIYFDALSHAANKILVSDVHNGVFSAELLLRMSRLSHYPPMSSISVPARCLH